GGVGVAWWFVLGGVAVFVHGPRPGRPPDRGILDHDVVWAAAGNPHTVFAMDPKSLVTHAGGTLVDVREAAGDTTADGRGAVGDTTADGREAVGDTSTDVREPSA
ncbi:hypothetical protein ACFW89_38275, partial [Streptomyces albidoflavus]